MFDFDDLRRSSESEERRPSPPPPDMSSGRRTGAGASGGEPSLDFGELRRSSAAAEVREDALEAKRASGGIAQGFASIEPRRRFVLALMLFFNVMVLGCLCLVALGRLALPF